MVDKEEKKEFKCRVCGKLLISKFSLGGHMSHAHKGVSYNYSRMLSVRNVRAAKRESLKVAKQTVKLEDYHC